jgi:outer membrane immunogenic protein
MGQRLFLAIGAVFLLSLAAPAMAQQEDNPWSGWYVGGNAGGTWGGAQSRTTVSPGGGAVVIPPADVSTINTTFLSRANNPEIAGGIEGGYGYRAGVVVLGLETDFGAFGVREQNATTYASAPTSPPAFYNLSHKLSTNWLWTLRPRVGYMTGRWFLYGTGGLALTDVTLRANYMDTRTPSNQTSFSTSSTRAGWTAGGGIAYALSPHWSIKVEYLYTDLGTIQGASGTPSGFVTLNGRSTITSNLVRMGVDFRF